MINIQLLRVMMLVVTLLLQALPVQGEAQTTYPDDGWWWDAGAPGRGYFIERQKEHVFVSAFLYDEDGNPEWLTAEGQYAPAESDSALIGSVAARVYRNTGGQCIGCNYVAPVEVASVQSPLLITFSDNRNGVLEWFGESVNISRFLWSWADTMDQLSGTWMLTQLENGAAVSQLVLIETDDINGVASIKNLVNAADVGSIESFDNDLVLELFGTSEDVLPLVMPESKRFYAGFGDSNALQVFAVRLDDMPMGVMGDSSGREPGSTAGILCEYYDSTPNAQASLTITSISEWSCSESSRVLSANGIPDHLVGTFPNAHNPNTITEQSVQASFTLTPTQSDSATEMGGPRAVIGYVLNGVKIDAGTAGTCDNSGSSCSLAGNVGSWSIEALGQSSFNFGDDQNHAHVQPNGSYHYHGIPEGFVAKRGGNSSTMTLIGWAADGFPIYARYGYSIADDANSAIKVITGSYQLVSSVSQFRPSTATYPLGTFTQDWEYVEGSGDLDECNGRVGVTPEFPEGIYHYYATDSFPYFQRCVKGNL